MVSAIGQSPLAQIAGRCVSYLPPVANRHFYWRRWCGRQHNNRRLAQAQIYEHPALPAGFAFEPP
jgi:hypothetical protein